MKFFVGILGLALLFATLWDAFETIILPRRVTRKYRFVRLFYRVNWSIWSWIHGLIRSNKLRDRHLSYFGPLSLLWLFATWAFGLVLAFAMLQWAAGSPIIVPRGGSPSF